MFSWRSCRIDSSRRAIMADQIVITEKSSQAKDVRAAVGSRYGDILPAEGHLFDLLEPEDVVPAWKVTPCWCRWFTVRRPSHSPTPLTELDLSHRRSFLALAQPACWRCISASVASSCSSVMAAGSIPSSASMLLGESRAPSASKSLITELLHA